MPGKVATLTACVYTLSSISLMRALLPNSTAGTRIDPCTGISQAVSVRCFRRARSVGYKATTVCTSHSPFARATRSSVKVAPFTSTAGW